MYFVEGALDSIGGSVSLNLDSRPKPGPRTKTILTKLDYRLLALSRLGHKKAAEKLN